MIGLRCIIGPGVTIRNSVIMGADDYEGESPSGSVPPLGIGAESFIEGAILDKNCRIGRGVRISNDQQIDQRGEEEPCVIREGIPVVLKGAELPDGWRL